MRSTSRYALTLLACAVAFAPRSDAASLARARPAAARPKPAFKPTTVNKVDLHMSTKYPGLAPLLKDPGAFFETMQGRFAAQKLKTPGAPYDFDFSELGMPLVKDLHRELNDRLEKLQAAPSSPQTTEAIAYLSQLRGESQKYLARDAVAYREIVEFSYFAARAMGQLDHAGISP